jgi:hypothetical protein
MIETESRKGTVGSPGTPVSVDRVVEAHEQISRIQPEESWTGGQNSRRR